MSASRRCGFCRQIGHYATCCPSKHIAGSAPQDAAPVVPLRPPQTFATQSQFKGLEKKVEDLIELVKLMAAQKDTQKRASVLVDSRGIEYAVPDQLMDSFIRIAQIIQPSRQTKAS